MKIRMIFALLMLATASSNTFGHSKMVQENKVDGPGIFSNSGIRGPKYNDQIKKMKQIANKYSELVKLVEYGESRGKNTLTALLFEPKNTLVTKFAMVTGAIHGNEYMNIVDRLSEALLDSPVDALRNYISTGGALLVVPIVNPDGYDKRRRGNSRRVDLNRDWPSSISTVPAQFEEPETIALATWISSYLQSHPMTKLNFVMDYHCCVDGMLLKPWGYQKGKYLTQSESERFDYFIDPMLKYFPRPGKVGTPPDLLYSAQGTTLDYWYAEYGAVTLTYEGNRRIEKDLLQNHVLWWEEILQNL